MKKRDKTIDDIFPQCNVELARREARTKSDTDYDIKFEVLFNTYISYDYESDIQLQVREEISKMFSRMIEEGYTPICVGFYQRIWEALQEAHKK